ncbi:unnamed protein product [Cylindrotheca closterium]|uniref:JmjC domain-containing protein n=1 Tax=Cylindrotheca closterium TaxID=2856 RepID=A0AAD2CSQ7_9STRA|nr:unnamed protein product [Cylindrotheca closterium]
MSPSNHENPPPPPPSNNTNHQGYANRHIPDFLALDCQQQGASQIIQVVTDGRQLTAEHLKKQQDDGGITLTRPILITDTPQSIGMKVIKFRGREVQLRDLANILGGAFPFAVIDVEHQEELEGWTLGAFVDYIEDPYRRKESGPSPLTAGLGGPKRKQRQAVVKALEKKAQQRPRVLNQISLEFSDTPLRQKITSPQFVRDLDWIDQAWPGRGKGQSKKSRVYPKVQYYCLTSAAGCYTDFHVDFGGTSVWYHVLSGQKDFCLIAPTKANLQVFEEWNCSANQATTFLPNLIQDQSTILRITLQPSQTMIIPSAWIHGVYTPSDSIVLGGNFLHGLDIEKQLEVYDIEERTKVMERFRCPLYKQLQFYAAGMYLNKMRKGDICTREVDGCSCLYETLRSWWDEYRDEVPETAPDKAPNVATAALEVARQHNCMDVDHFLFDFKQEYTRVKQHGICPNEDKATTRTMSEPVLDRPKLKLKLKANDGMSSKPEKPQSQPSTVPKVEAVTSQSTGSTEPKKVIRLKLKTADTAPQPVAQESSSAADPFRIVLSSSTIFSAKVAAPTKPKVTVKRVREDTEWFDEGPVPDDEWMPSSSTNNNKTKKAKGMPNSSNSSSSSSRGKNKGKQGTKSTARSRLMGRLR